MLFEFHRPSLGDVNDPASLGWVGPGDRDSNDEDGLRVTRPGKVHTIAYADIPGNSWNASRLNKARERINELLVNRVPLSSLPDSDPDKFTDPADPPRLYWDGGDLCSRRYEITALSFDPVAERLNLEWRRLF